jgi:hypothetical protein
MGTAVGAVSVGVGALICLAVYIVLHKHPKVNPVKTKALLMMGVFLGIGGIAGSLIHNGARLIGKLLNGPVAIAVGAGVPLAVAIGLAVWMYHDFRPKNKSPHRHFPIICAAFVVMLYVVGGTIEGMGAGLGSEALTQIGATLNDGLMALKF